MRDITGHSSDYPIDDHYIKTVIDGMNDMRSFFENEAFDAFSKTLRDERNATINPSHEPVDHLLNPAYQDTKSQEHAMVTLYHSQLAGFGFILHQEYPNLKNMPVETYMREIGECPGNKEFMKKRADDLQEQYIHHKKEEAATSQEPAYQNELENRWNILKEIILLKSRVVQYDNIEKSIRALRDNDPQLFLNDQGKAVLKSGSALQAENILMKTIKKREERRNEKTPA